MPLERVCGRGRDSHDEVEAPELLDASAHRCFEARHLAHVDGADAEDFRARSRRGDVAGHAFGLVDVAADDAGGGAEVNHCSDLGAADCACAAGAEDDFVCCVQLGRGCSALGVFG